MKEIRIHAEGKKVTVDLDGSPIYESEYEHLKTQDVMLFLVGHITTGLTKTRQSEAQLSSLG